MQSFERVGKQRSLGVTLQCVPGSRRIGGFMASQLSIDDGQSECDNADCHPHPANRRQPLAETDWHSCKYGKLQAGLKGG